MKALKGRGCMVLAGLERPMAALEAAVAPAAASQATHAAGRPAGGPCIGIDAVVVLGAAPVMAQDWVRPGQLQVAAVAAVKAIEEGTPVYAITEEGGRRGPEEVLGFRSGVDAVEWLAYRVTQMPPEPSQTVSSRWDEAASRVHRDDADEILHYLRDFPELRQARDEQGRTLLHLAAAAGAHGVSVALLEARCGWGSRDLLGLTAGDVAFACSHQHVFDALVARAATAERAKLGALGPAERAQVGSGPQPKRRRQSAEHEAYVHQRLHYDAGRLLDAGKHGVMMCWESPLMAKHAEVLLPKSSADVLNIGFGLGLVDGLLQARHPRSHTIVEVHPDVLAEMKLRGWHEKPGVVVHAGRWQDVVDHFPPGSFDAIFVDTWRETYTEVRCLFAELPRLLRPGGRFSYFNGFAPHNIFEHAVICRMAQLDLSDLGLQCAILPVEVGALSEDVWKGVRQCYWQFETYYLPLAMLRPHDSESPPQDGSGWRHWPSPPIRISDRVGTCISANPTHGLIACITSPESSSEAEASSEIPAV